MENVGDPAKSDGLKADIAQQLKHWQLLLLA
jgi:hypothetical protein